MASNLKVSLLIEAIDRATRPLRRVAGAVQRMAGNSGFGRVARAAGQVGRATGKVVRELSSLGKRGVLAVTALSAAVYGLVKSFANAGDSAAKAASKLGVGVEWLQRYRYAAGLANIDQNTFDMALQRFVRRSAEAAAGTGEAEGALKFLGIRLKDASGRMRPVEQLLSEVADAMAKIEDPSVRVRVAFKLFDSEGVAMVNMLGEGAAALAQTAAEADRLGIVIGEKAARQSEEFNDNMARLMASVTGVGRAIAGYLLPILDPMLVKLREWLVANRALITARVTAFIDQLVAALPEMIRQVTEAAAMFVRIGRTIWPVIEILGGLKTVIIAVSALLGAKLILSIGSTVIALGQLGAALLATPAGWILAAIAAIAAAAYLIYANWGEIAGFFTDLWDRVVGAFTAFEQRLDRVWARIRAAALSLKLVFLDAIGGIVSAIGDLVDSLPAFVRKRIGLDGIGDFAVRIDQARQRTERQRDRLLEQANGDARAAPPIGAGDRQRPAAQAQAAVKVEFSNLPRGARVRPERNSGVDLDLSAGYAMATP